MVDRGSSQLWSRRRLDHLDVTCYIHFFIRAGLLLLFKQQQMLRGTFLEVALNSEKDIHLCILQLGEYKFIFPNIP